jgi:hypothetical protein
VHSYCRLAGKRRTRRRASFLHVSHGRLTNGTKTVYHKATQLRTRIFRVRRALRGALPIPAVSGSFAPLLPRILLAKPKPSEKVSDSAGTDVHSAAVPPDGSRRNYPETKATLDRELLTRSPRDG